MNPYASTLHPAYASSFPVLKTHHHHLPQTQFTLNTSINLQGLNTQCLVRCSDFIIPYGVHYVRTMSCC